MKTKDEVVLATLRTLIDATEGLAARLDTEEHGAWAAPVLGELDARRSELAETFELVSEVKS